MTSRQSFTSDMAEGGTLSCLRVGGGQGKLYRLRDCELNLEGHMDIFWMKEERGGEGRHSKQRVMGIQDQACWEIARGTEGL